MRTKISEDNYYVVQGWMITKLELKGNALAIYAIIYGFSQIAHQEFTASINYLCEWLGASRPTVINTLKDLVEKNLLTKVSNEINGIIYNRYTAIVPDFTGGKEILLGSQNSLLGGSKNSLPNNIYNKNMEKDIESVEQGSTPPYQMIIDYLNEQIGSNFRSSSKENQKCISARWKEGFSLPDFKRVIDIKVKEWKHDKKMAPYLRPITLFSPKFEAYLNQTTGGDPVSDLSKDEELVDRKF